MNKDSIRAMWVAELAIAYTGIMSDGKRLELLGLFFDSAYADGVVDGIDRMARAAKEPA